MIRMILTGVLVAVLTVGCSKAPEQKEIVRPIFASQVGTDAEKTGRSFPGRAQANQEVDLSFRVAGPLIELPNDIVGRTYRQGEVIARIDPRDYEVQLQDAEGRLEQGRSAEKRAQGEYKRELNIYKQDPGATSKTSVDRKRDLRDQAAGDVKSLEASQQAARDNLDYTSLKAPFDGMVTSRYVDNFQDVRAKQKVVRLLDASRIQIVVDIPETLISRLPQVEAFWVIFDAFPGRKIPAQLFEVGTEASLTTRTYPVTLIMDPPDDIEILAGMAGRAYGRHKADASVDSSTLVVPASSVFTPDMEKQSYVWVIDKDNGTVSRRQITQGELTTNGIIVTEGLKAGEWVATAGVHSLKQGQKVRIIESGRE
jgi:RND family efflux transporter MFP subunit